MDTAAKTPDWDDFEGRIELACLGQPDVADIPKVDGAGEVVVREGVEWQVMFNGLRMRAGGYYGGWMTELIRRLGGHHEPQEERVFHELVERLEKPASMIELGAYWGWYSLWFKSRHPGTTVVLTEPDPENLAVASRNAVENSLQVRVELGGVCPDPSAIGPGRAWDFENGVSIPALSVPELMARHGFERLTILHADIQGAELTMLKEADELFAGRRIDYLFVSTHWPAIHAKCRSFLDAHGYRFIAEHTPEESYSFDGLLVACSPELDPFEVAIHKRDA